jgi:Ca2+-binding RTX toxin-like protein
VTVTVNGRATQYLAITNPEITVNGLGGSDVIDGRLLQTVRLVANGGAGNDLIFGGQADDRLSGGEGGDVIYGQGGDDVITGGAGNDLLLGGAGDDELYGEAGLDVLDGGAGTDRVSGGGGINVLFLDSEDEFVLGTGIDLIIRRR